MKSKRLMAVFLTAVMVIMALAGNGTKADAATAIQVVDGASKNIVVAPGEKKHIKLPIRAVGEYILNPTVTATPADGAPFSISGVKITVENVEGTAPGISTYGSTNLEFDIDMKDTAKIKNYPLSFNFSYVSSSFDTDTGEGSGQNANVKLDVNIQVLEEKAPAQLVVQEVRFDENSVAIGSTFDLSFLVKNEGEIKALNTFVTINYGDTGMVPGYTVESIRLGDLAKDASQKIEVPISVLPTATEGLKKLEVSISYTDSDGTNIPATTRSIYITVLKSGSGDTNDANLVINSTTYTEDVLAGSGLNLTADILNNGAETAKNVSVSIASGVGVENGIIPDFTGDSIPVDDIKAGKSKKISIPLIISKGATSGLKAITIQAKYTNSEDKQVTSVATVYISVTAASTTEVKNEVAISNVTQSPSAPQAGEKMSVSFKIENKGNSDIKDVKMSAKNLSAMGFEPVSSEPYQTIGTIGAGQSKSVTMSFMVGASIPEGMNTLSLVCNYTDASGAAQTQETTVYILDVQNASGTLSKPKLIISNFSTVPDPEKGDLRAGSQFDFKLEIQNTHTSVAARNIKVTVTQSEGIFSVAEGSNSIYIASIRPEEKYEATIRMKVKNDAATKSYPLDIAIEYDYDGMKATETGDGSVSVKDTLNLQAVENARPVVQNISVGSWETPTINQSAAMNFDFYNMGKSTLNNVQFKLEGDFQFENGDTYIYYMGNIQGGSSEYGDVNVIPLVEGQAKGTLICMFEDSNGDPQEVRYDFENTVQGEYIPDYNPGGDGGGFQPIVPEAKAPIVPLWVFLCIQAAILIIGIPVTRKIVLSLHRRKLMKQEEE